MNKSTLETSFQFPFFVFNELVSYLEVKKPSGIAYMLLVLFNESNDKNALICNVLENFGVPKSLHYIFADTIKNLTEQEILETNSGYSFDRSAFNIYKIDDFSFTKKGKKIFADESIPTGVEKQAKIPLFFDIAMNQLVLIPNPSLELKPLKDCAITDEFMERFTCDKNEEDFLNRNKGVSIPIYVRGKIDRNELIKQEEVITSVNLISEKEHWVGKYDCTMEFDQNLISFNFENKSVQRFFDENYDSQIVMRTLGYKNKFKFKSKYSTGLSLTNFNGEEISSILFPDEIDDILKQKDQLIITRGNYDSRNYLSVESVDGLNTYNANCEFVILDQSNNIYAYIPGKFEFSCQTIKRVSIPLVLKVKVSSEALKNMLVPYLDSLKTYTEESLRSLISITNITKDYEKANSILASYFGDDAESNLVLLKEIKPTAMLNSNLFKKYKELVQSNYHQYLKTATEDNLEILLEITSNTPRLLNLSEKDVLSDLFATLGEIEHKQSIYEMLVAEGFDKSLVVLYVDPAEEVFKNRKPNEKTLVDLINFDNCINSLKELTNIADYQKYIFNNDGVNRLKFKKFYDTALSLQKEIDIFRLKNLARFQKYDGFMALFGKINDEFNMLDNALKDPNKITSELIEKKINLGDYQFVFVNLSAKLEIILKNKYELDGTLSSMLSNARKSGKIKKEVINDLHDFRENRNANIHPEDRTADYTADDLRRWSKEIFDLEEENK